MGLCGSPPSAGRRLTAVGGEEAPQALEAQPHGRADQARQQRVQDQAPGEVRRERDPCVDELDDDEVPRAAGEAPADDQREDEGPAAREEVTGQGPRAALGGPE